MKKILLLTLGFIASVSIYRAQCDDPTVNSPQAYCGGVSSIPLEAFGTDPSMTYTINMFDSWGDGWNGNEITIFGDGTSLITATITAAQGGANSETFTVLEGSLLTATWVTGSFTGEVSFDIVDNNGAVVFSGLFGATIDYTVPEIGPYTLTWYDSPSGTALGTGSPFEAVGTSVMPTASTGSYSFYVTQTGVGCTESGAVELVVDVTDVNVVLLEQDESCTGNADGTFSIASVNCGTAPFSFSVDGSAFGPAPTDMTPGTYVVIVEDAASLQSSPITIVIGTANTVIPNPPTSDSPLSYCSGATSIPLDATATGLSLTYTINMFDAFGDGWNGNVINIYNQNGDLLVSATIAAGATGSATFNVIEGDFITALWDLGTWESEVSFQIVDNLGVTVFSGNYGDAIDYNVPPGVYPLSWYDAVGGTVLGTGSPFEAVGSSVMPTSSVGSYDFFVTQSNGGCESSATQVTVNISDVTVTLSVQDETCTGYTNGTFAIDAVDCGTAPFTFSVDGGAFGPAPGLTAGTYSVVVMDASSLESTAMSITINTTETVIPFPATVNEPDVYACVGDTTVMVAAVGEVTALDSLLTTMAAGNGQDGVMFPITAINQVTIQDFAINLQAGTNSAEIYYRPDNYLNVPGSNTNAAGWTLVGSAATVVSATPNYTDLPIPVNITIPAGQTYSFHLIMGAAGANVSYTNGTGTGNVFASDANMEFIEGHGGTLFGCTFNPRVFNGLIRYEATQFIDVTWFDMASGGAVIGNGTPLEAIGTSVMADANTAGDYSFFVASNNNGCYSATTEEVTVHVADVNVEISSIDATCNTGTDGSFVIDSVMCGTAPFTYSVDGGAAGPAPTDLSPGTYEVIVIDAAGDSSSVYYVTVGSAAGPSDLVITDLSDTSVQVCWTPNGSETAWIIEYGAPGFTPGTGTEIGSASVTDTCAVITGLDGNTDYDFYVSADCGTTPGDWGAISFTTDCGAYSVPFMETFEDDSETRVCWYNINEVGADDWTYDIGSGGGVGGAAMAAYEGDLNARFVSMPTTSTTKLASPRIDVSSQDSVAIIFAYAQEMWAGDQNTTKVFIRGSETSPWTEISSYTSDTPEWTLDTLFVADTSNQLEIAFEGTNNWGRANVVDAVQVLPCSLEPGIDGTDNVCRAVDTVDLNSFITPGEDFGYWSFPPMESFVNGSVASVQFLPEGSHDFLYVVSTPCASDTTIATLVIYGPSSAGNDGADTICMNEPYNLLTSLSGSIDLGGDWIDPTGALLSGPNIIGSSIPGSYNYQYVTSNGVCDGDTSIVLLFVDPDCDYNIGLVETDLSFFELYPNPTNGEFSIKANDADGFYSVVVTDVNGRIISTFKNYISGNDSKTIDLTLSENGVYFVKIYNDSVFKTYRIVKN